jgi:molybdopterin-guanine dinucleotide biosynthesis protein A
VTAIVLAGGRSRRMRADKAGLDVGGRTLLEHVLAQVEPLVDEVLVSRSPGRSLPIRPRQAAKGTGLPWPQPSGAEVLLRVIPDDAAGLGPLAGILAGLRAARNDACLVVACDIPEIDVPLLQSLSRSACGSEIAVPIGPSGLYEPLFALYRKSVIPAIEGLLASGERSILPLFGRCRTAVVKLEDASWIRNLNTRDDYASYLRSIGKTGPARSAAPARRDGRKRAPASPAARERRPAR